MSFLRIAVPSFFFAPLLALGTPPQTNLAPVHDPVAQAVVQLLAVGPGGNGQNLECSGTGFMVNENGYILTNAHVIEKGRECLGQTPGARWIARRAARGGHSDGPAHDGARSGTESAPGVECEIVAVDDLHDLAVMKPDHPWLKGDAGRATPYVWLDSAEVPAGTRIKVTGHPSLAWIAQTHGGEIIGRRSLALFEGSGEQTEMLILNFSLKYGQSGSPVYRDASGGVVGIVERRNTAVEWQTLAVPIRYATDFLDGHGVKWHAAPR